MVGYLIAGGRCNLSQYDCRIDTDNSLDVGHRILTPINCLQMLFCIPLISTCLSKIIEVYRFSIGIQCNIILYDIDCSILDCGYCVVTICDSLQ